MQNKPELRPTFGHKKLLTISEWTEPSLSSTTNSSTVDGTTCSTRLYVYQQINSAVLTELAHQLQLVPRDGTRYHAARFLHRDRTSRSTRP